MKKWKSATYFLSTLLSYVSEKTVTKIMKKSANIGI